MNDEDEENIEEEIIEKDKEETPEKDKGLIVLLAEEIYSTIKQTINRCNYLKNLNVNDIAYCIENLDNHSKNQYSLNMEQRITLDIIKKELSIIGNGNLEELIQNVKNLFKEIATKYDTAVNYCTKKECEPCIKEMQNVQDKTLKIIELMENAKLKTEQTETKDDATHMYN